MAPLELEPLPPEKPSRRLSHRPRPRPRLRPPLPRPTRLRPPLSNPRPVSRRSLSQPRSQRYHPQPPLGTTCLRKTILHYRRGRLPWAGPRKSFNCFCRPRGQIISRGPGGPKCRSSPTTCVWLPARWANWQNGKDFTLAATGVGQRTIAPDCAGC